MNEYNLYLDESYDREKKKYLIAGFAIEKSQEEKLQEEMHKIKTIFWDEEYIEKNETVLHCTELSVINNNRKNKELHKYVKRDCYNIFKTMDCSEIKEKIERMIVHLGIIIKSLDVTLFGCLIDEEMYNYLYTDKSMHDEIYNIGIQCLVENYVHFLHQKKAAGNIFYESLNDGNTIKSDNVKMKKNFYTIVTNNKGIVYINSKKVDESIRDFSFPKKNEEVAGLELADFVCFYLFKACFRDEAQKSEFMKIIEKKLYNGNYNLEERDVRSHFGLRIVPEDIKRVNELGNELKKIKKGYSNIKRECRKMYEKNRRLIEEKRALEEEYNSLKEKYNKVIDKGNI